MKQTVTIDRIAGRDGSTAAQLSIPMHRAQECLNVEFYQAPCGRKRKGASALSLSGASFTGVISSLHRVQLSASSAATLLGIDDAATPVVSVHSGVGGSWSAVSMKDNIASQPWNMFGATLNGLYYYTGDTTQDRLHVFNGTTTRRVGLATPAAATVANTGSGSYAATVRYYKVCYTVQSGGSTLYRSELSPSVTFTPSGSGTHARITKPASISENETHWEVYASTDNEVFYGPIATTVVGTTTYDDNLATTAYAGYDLAPLVGQNTVPSSWKHILSDGNRLIGAGSWESGGKASRVWFTPIIGTTSSAFYDQERVPDVFGVQQNWIDLDESDGGVITGLVGPYYGAIYVFKQRQIWKLVPTGDGLVPYRPYQIGRGSGIGAVCQQGIVMAEDEMGGTAIYFWSHRGPYRLTVQGLQYIGADVEDYPINLVAAQVPVVGIYYPTKHQIWFHATLDTYVGYEGGGAPPATYDDPLVRLVLDPYLMRAEAVDGGPSLVRNGWSVHSGGIGNVRCAALYTHSYALGNGRVDVPYVGRATGTALWRTDTGTTDASTTFQALITLPTRHYAGISHKCRLFPPVLVGSAGSHSLTVTYTGDYAFSANATGAVTMSGSNRAVAQVEGVMLDDSYAVGVAVGDATAIDSASWMLDAITFAVERGAAVAVA